LSHFVHCFVDHCLSFCPLSFGQRIVDSVSDYPFGIFKFFLNELAFCVNPIQYFRRRQEDNKKYTLLCNLAL